jgi:polysaccharide biosynthesis protein PslH
VPAAVVICPVVPWPPVTGAQKRTLRLLETMEEAGVAPHVISEGPDGAPAEALRERGWRVDVLPGSPPSPRDRLGQHLRRLPSPYLPAVARRLEELRAEAPAFVQVEHAMAAYYAEHHPASRWILSMHNVDAQVHRTGGLRARWRAASTAAVERRAAPAADVVLCVSEEDRTHFDALGARTLLVPNGIDDEFFAVPAALPEGERVLFFGRLDYPPNELGLRRFLQDGWPRLAAARPAATLRVAGAGLPERLAREIAAAPRAEALGLVGDLAAELASARAVVLPVWHGGGTRLKALEALAAARPVAGTPLSVAGIGFRDGAHGLLAERPEALADAVAALLADPERSATLAVTARAHAEAFRWSRVTRPLLELYSAWAA